MYTILLNEQNELIATHRERIMQRSKLVDSFRILLDIEYKDNDMGEFTPYIEYVLPISKKYVTEKLDSNLSEEFEDKIELVLPFNTNLTSEAGNIEFQITFIKADLDVYGKPLQYVRKTSTCDITIVPIAAWSDIVPDDALNAVDQAFVKAEAMIKQLDDLAQSIEENKADNIAITEEGSVQLKSNGNFIGDPIDLAVVEKSDSDDDDVDGILDITGKYTTINI